MNSTEFEVLDFTDMPETAPGAVPVIEDADSALGDGKNIRKLITWTSLAVAQGVAASGLAVSIVQNLLK
jgi:hypothetical protein